MAATSFLTAITRRLEGKVALITGGASGIGESTARVFVNHGAKVIVADIQDEAGHTLSQSLGGEANCQYVHCDVSDESHVSDAVDRAVETYGKLDVIFNNAGTFDEYKPRIADNRKADFERVIATNVTGVFLGIKHAARVMVPRRSGCVLSTASTASIVGAVGSHAYTCSKHAVVGLTRNAAVELGQFGIRVNCLSPSGVATQMTKSFGSLDEEGVEKLMNSVANLKGVTLKAEDVANAALFLASEEGRYISGHNLLIDGGFSVVNPSFRMFQYPESD